MHGWINALVFLKDVLAQPFGFFFVALAQTIRRKPRLGEALEGTTK